MVALSFFFVCGEIAIKQKEIINNESKLLKSDFWIKRKKNPEKTILDAYAIENLNKRILRRGYLLNPLNLGEKVSSRLVINYLESDLNLMFRYIKYDLLGNRYRDPQFSNHLAKLINLKAVKNKTAVKVKYGVTVKNVNIRFFPTNKVYVRKKSEDYFDIMQKTHLSWGSPVAILHASQNKKWYLVETIYARGWVEKEAIALITFQNLKRYLHNKSNAITTEAKNFIYLSKKTLKPLDYVLPMGFKLKLSEKNSTLTKSMERLAILLPKKNSLGYFTLETFFIEKKNVHEGYLAFNEKNLLQQGFKFLNVPYSWGGSAHGVDCSLFLVRVFNSFGLQLPRASVLQKRIFNQNLKDNRNNEHFPQIAFLPSPNHIMLFLGNYDGKDYYIHSLWSFYDEKNKEFEIKSVIVSDNQLGYKSRLGSLEERISHKGRLSSATIN